MNPHLRKATLIDVPRLWELRQNSIIELGPEGMPTTQAEVWATTMTITGVEERFSELRFGLRSRMDL